MCDSWDAHFIFFISKMIPKNDLNVQWWFFGTVECLTAWFLIYNVSDYEASLKKEGGIPDGPVLESLLAGETLDKKVETKEEESMSECQVRHPIVQHLIIPSILVFWPSTWSFSFLSVWIILYVGDSLSVSAFVSLCFGCARGSRHSNLFLLAACVLVITCECALCTCVFCSD